MKLLCNTLQNELSSAMQEDMQILTPIRGSVCGTYQVNKMVSKIIRENSLVSGSEFHYGSMTYQRGDKVIFQKTNYLRGYYNGDIGYVEEIIKDGMLVRVGKDVRRVTGEAFREITLAYAITMHKSQGSEFHNVIILLPDTYKYMLTRNLLFTAVTRARNKVTIIYIKSALYDAVHTITISKRYTGLTEKLRKVIKDV